MVRPHPLGQSLGHSLLGLLVAVGTLTLPATICFAQGGQANPRLPGEQLFQQIGQAPNFQAPDADQAPKIEEAPAPPGQLDNESLDALIRQLNDADLATRDRAQLRLATSDGVDLSRIEEYLDTADLSPEQRLRLGAVGFDLFSSAPASARPAMGVEFGTRFGGIASVTINRTVPGFDSANVLAAGDIILRMDGIPVQNFDHARQIILSFDPQDQISISVIRNGEPVDTVVRFGSFVQLPNPSSPSSDMLREAWSIRRARRAPDHATPVIVALDPSLRRGDPALAPQVASQAWRAVGQWVARRLGDENYTFDGRVATYLRERLSDASPVILPAGAQRAIEPAATEPFKNVPMTAQMAAQLQLIDNKIASLTNEKRALQKQLRDQRLARELRSQINARIRAIDRDLVQARESRRQFLGP